MPLTRVTITGADDSTDPQELRRLTEEFPFVEWGILVGSKEKSRFPSVSWIHRLELECAAVGNRMNLSLHVCSKFMREMESGKSSLYEVLGYQLFHFQRMQLNCNGHRKSSQYAENVLNAICQLESESIGWDPHLIFQWGSESDKFYEPCGRRFACFGLFDRSGGRGVSPSEWPIASDDLPCGWAGGLGPDNLQEELLKIDLVSFPSVNYWVDMESKVRTDDGQSLDLGRVRRCLEIAATLVKAS